MKKLYSLLFLVFLAFQSWSQTVAPLPPHNNVFTGNVRGYWFTSPSCFTITGLEVAQEAGAGNQNIAVLLLQSVPPLYSATTNAFSTLYVTQNNPNLGVIPVNINIQAGDIIMILGQRGTNNSYASSTATAQTTINGQTVALNRAGMQFQLGTTLPQDVWSINSSQISRVFFTYTTSGSTITLNTNQTGVSTYEFNATVDTASTTVVWNYGDGSPLDTVDTGNHTYTAPGTYNVCSYVLSNCGNDTVCTTLTTCGPDPISQFSANSTGLSASFQDSSAYAVSWMWDFGDGTTDTVANPTHTYSNIGWYNVCLMTENGCGVADTLCDSVLVCVAPTALMSTSLTGNTTVVCTDASSNALDWLWDFGDGATSTQQNPTHTYTNDGTYVVCLTVTNPCGTSTQCDTVTVCVTPLSAGFTSSTSLFDVTFTDNSTGANTYAWDFGDGNTSNLQNPVHSYAQNGSYVVCLTTGNACGQTETECDTVEIFVVSTLDPASGIHVQLAPNPVTDQSFLTVMGDGRVGEYQLRIFDLRGVEVSQQVGNWGTPLLVNRNGLSTGVYLYRIESNAQVIANGRMAVQ